MAINIDFCGEVGAPLGFKGKQHLDPKMSVSTILDLDSLVDYLPNYSLVIVEEGEDAGHVFQLQPDGTWLDTNIGGNAAMLDDAQISDLSTYSSSKIDSTYAKVADVYTKTESDTNFGTLTQQASNTNAIVNLTAKVDSIGNAVQYKGNVSTYGDLLLLEDVQNGSLYIIDADETRDFTSTKYIYDGETWIFNGVQEVAMRDFEVNPINLGSEVDGVHHTEVAGLLPLSNVDMSELGADDISYDNEDYPTVKDALDKLLYKALTITFSTTATRVLERGNTVVNPVFNWLYNKNIIQQTFDNEVLDNELRTYTYNGTVSANKTFILKANDGTKDYSSAISFAFYDAIYCGTSEIPDTLDSDFVLSLTSKKLQNSVKGDYTVNCGDKQYVWFALPTDLCNGISFWNAGFQGGVAEIASLEVENIYNSTHNYKIFRSDNHSLGQTTITIK